LSVSDKDSLFKKKLCLFLRVKKCGKQTNLKQKNNDTVRSEQKEKQIMAFSRHLHTGSDKEKGYCIKRFSLI
jgi:hypothetical protein